MLLFLNNPTILILTVIKYNGEIEYIGRTDALENDKSNNVVSIIMKELDESCKRNKKTPKEEMTYPTNISTEIMLKWKEELKNNPDYVLGKRTKYSFLSDIELETNIESNKTTPKEKQTQNPNQEISLYIPLPPHEY